MLTIQYSRSFEQPPKALYDSDTPSDGDFIPQDRRSIAGERERREPTDRRSRAPDGSSGSEPDRDPSQRGRWTARERSYLSRRGGRPYMRRRRAVASTNRTRANTSAVVHVRYDVRRTTSRRSTFPSRRRHSSSHRNHSDKCTAVAADDVSAVLQNDDHLDHPVDPRRRLSR